MLAYFDETSEAAAGMLRTGNAGANTAADQIAVAEAALEQIPAERARGIEVLLRVDSAVGVPREEVTMKGVTYGDMRPGSYELKPRLEDMDVNHLEAALCFPTFPRFC